MLVWVLFMLVIFLDLVGNELLIYYFVDVCLVLCIFVIWMLIEFGVVFF